MEEFSNINSNKCKEISTETYINSFSLLTPDKIVIGNIIIHVLEM